MDAKPEQDAEGNDIDPEELKKKEVAKDPWEARLKPITQDNQTPGNMPAWIVRGYNLKDNYVNDQPGKPAKNFGTVVVKSMQWPGSFTMYSQEQTFSIYCGNGLKNEDVTYYPVDPPVMQTDKKEVKPCDEPNPTEEWLQKKADLEAKAAAANQPPADE